MLSPSSPFVTPQVFASCNSFLNASSSLVAQQYFEVRGAVNLHEYLSVLVLFASAAWVDKCRLLFNLFDFDGSDSLSAEETVILLSSVLCGFCKSTGQGIPTSQELAAAAQELTSVRALRLPDFLTLAQNSALVPTLVKFDCEAKPFPSCFFVFHKLVRHSFTPSVTRESRSFSRKSSHALDYSPSFGHSSPRLRGSLPPTSRTQSKGLIIVRANQDGEHLTRKRVADIRASFDQMANPYGRLSLSLLLNSQTVPSNARKAANRVLQKANESGDGSVSFEEFLKLLFPRATNTQLSIIRGWGGGEERGLGRGTPIVRPVETPSVLHGEFFIVPKDLRKGSPLPVLR